MTGTSDRKNQNQPVTYHLTVADYDGYLFENPEHDDPQKIRYLLASTLQSVISQRLVADADGLRRFPACEILIATSTIREYIREPEKTVLIRQAIQEGFIQYQMQTFDQSLMQLYKEGRVTLDTALNASTNPHEFMLRVKGIQASSDNTWQRFEGGAQDEGKPQMSRI